MKPTNLQVERSLSALREERSTDGSTAALASSGTTAQLPDGLIERIESLPAVRADRLRESREHLDDEAGPDAADLAGKMVGRIVCDRLR